MKNLKVKISDFGPLPENPEEGKYLKLDSGGIRMVHIVKYKATNSGGIDFPEYYGIPEYGGRPAIRTHQYLKIKIDES